MTPDDTGLGGLLQLLSPALAAAAILISHTCPEMDIASTASKSSELPCAAHVAGSDGITPSVDLQGTRCTMSGPAQTCLVGGPSGLHVRYQQKPVAKARPAACLVWLSKGGSLDVS